MTTNNWQTFLIQVGAHFTESGTCSFQTLEQAAETTQVNCLADLSHLGLIAVQGPDAEKFLQGQLTCDVREITEQQTRLAAHCNSKGRIIGTFRLFRMADTYYLQLPSTILEIALTHLRKYAVFSKVSLSDASDNFIKIGFTGTVKLSSHLPDTIDSAIIHDDMLIFRLPGITPRYEAMGNYATIRALWQQLATDMQPISHNDWNLLDIMAGIPSVYPETCELFTPHQLNYQLINGINFKKGCYTGQEVIARMHYLGKLKQHMYRATILSEQAPKPGEAILMNKDGELQQVGEVVMSARTSDGYQLLTTLQDKGLDYPLQLNNTRITLLDLPYLSLN
ncbi:MAG: folate-binding protein YgfZ [Gammaproteobacteria bacterium]|jgi:folate-binding protein YgfZ|nr:folate-binding protein YgfZ [Gammaproteobacteria bacterium]